MKRSEISVPQPFFGRNGFGIDSIIFHNRVYLIHQQRRNDGNTAYHLDGEGGGSEIVRWPPTTRLTLKSSLKGHTGAETGEERRG